MRILPCLNIKNESDLDSGPDEVLDLAAAFLMGDPPRAFGPAIEEFELQVYADIKLRFGNRFCTPREWREFLATFPEVKFLRRYLRVEIEYVTRVPIESHTVWEMGAGKAPGQLGKVKMKRAVSSLESFRTACQEMAASLSLAEPKLRKSDKFNWNAFSAHLDKRLARLPASRAEFRRLSKKLVSPWNRVQKSNAPDPEPSARALKKRPKLITINPDDDCASHIGRTADGGQFFLTTPFIPAQSEFVALYLFDAKGKFQKAHIDNLGKREKLDPKRDREAFERRFAQLGPVKLGRIRIEPFKVRRFGRDFGLIPQLLEDEEDGWTVEAQPGNYMAFFKPWNSGEYDT